MSIAKVRAYFEEFGIADRIREFDVSSATVDLAAIAVGVEGARIAKTLSFKVNEEPILVVAAGDAKVDNGKYKAAFGGKAKMLTADEVVEQLSDAGVHGVWNFTGKEIEIEGGQVVIENVHIGDSLMTLCYEVAQKMYSVEEKDK